jgi:hypothetical protein
VKLEAMAPSARYVGAMLALMFVVSGAVRAEPAFSFDATPGKLRKSVVPISYSIELRPDAESLALPGVEVIDVEVREPTARLTLNAVNTTFASVTVDDSLTRADVTLDAAAETATFIFAQPLAAGAHRLRIEFTARINKFDRGFFFERLRYYYAAASARNPALAHLTLALTLTDEVPGTIVTGLIGSVASFAEQPDLAWDFLQKNYDALFAKQGPAFRDQFIANFMTNFSDEGHAAELAAFAPVQATSGGRVMAGRAQEVIAISADLKSRALPAVEAWIKARK